MRTLCDPPVTHQSCDILAAEGSWLPLVCWRGWRLLEGAVIAGSVRPRSQLPLGPAEQGRDGFQSTAWCLWLGHMEACGWTRGQRQESAKDLQERPRTESFGFEAIACFLIVAFLHSFLFWLAYELSISLACVPFS